MSDKFKILFFVFCAFLLIGAIYGSILEVEEEKRFKKAILEHIENCECKEGP